MHNITQPVLFAYWIARLGPRCPEAVTLGLAALLASFTLRAGCHKLEIRSVGSLAEAKARCFLAAITGFAQAARTIPTSVQSLQHPARTQPKLPQGHIQHQSDHHHRYHVKKLGGKAKGKAAVQTTPVR